MYSYFAGDVVTGKEIGEDNFKKLVRDGFIKVDAAAVAAETPEAHLKPADLEIRTGGEAAPTPGAGLPATEGMPVADVSDTERLGLKETPIAIPAIDPVKPAKK